MAATARAHFSGLGGHALTKGGVSAATREIMRWRPWLGDHSTESLELKAIVMVLWDGDLHCCPRAVARASLAGHARSSDPIAPGLRQRPKGERGLAVAARPAVVHREAARPAERKPSSGGVERGSHGARPRGIRPPVFVVTQRILQNARSAV